MALSGNGKAPRRAIVGIGLKMHLGYAATLDYLGSLAAAQERLADVEVFVLPSFPMIPAARALLADTQIAYGAQDGHWVDAGPHTGSVAPGTLAELGCTMMEVGHAERRRDFGEDDVMTGMKAAAALRWGLTPIICVGEQSKSADAPRIVADQVRSTFEHIPVRSGPIIVAYEPVWAIGCNEAAPPLRIRAVVEAIRSAVAWRDTDTRIVYGGGVTATNARGILDAGADGVFASRALIDVADVEELVRRLPGSRSPTSNLEPTTNTSGCTPKRDWSIVPERGHPRP
jgi:triosephosphate isomerase